MALPPNDIYIEKDDSFEKITFEAIRENYDSVLILHWQSIIQTIRY